MNELVSYLLDVAGIQKGTLAVSPEPADVSVQVDRRRIVQVLGNLLSNAARYSPAHSPISVSAAREGVHVVVTVTDSGRGVPEEWLPQLFQKFSGMGEEGRGPALGGSGLGLAICRGIVESHGGAHPGRERWRGHGDQVRLHHSGGGGSRGHGFSLH